MAIDYDKFLSWAESRWHGDVVVKGDEIKLNSPFCEDYKHHLWCNVAGGKKDRPNGVFHCWKTEERGSLISLVMFQDGCAYEEALEILGGEDTFLVDAEAQLAAMFDGTADATVEVVESVELRLPPNTYLLTDLEPSNFYRVGAEVYMFSRKLSPKGLMVCTGGKLGDIDYKNRIIIPYYDRYGDLIYFNGRYLGTSKKIPKYLGPPKNLGVGKGDVIYFPSWPPSGVKIYLAEGEFDALTLQLTGLWSAAFGGKEISEKQVEILRNLQPVLCLDNDRAGKNSLPEIGAAMMRGGISPVRYVRPPGEYKDWNAMLQKLGPRIIAAYIKNQEKPLDVLEWEIRSGVVAKNFLPDD